MSDFKEYFSHDVEYPDPAVDPLPMGTEYSYISSTFLDGWINYVEIVEARLICRYKTQDENFTKSSIFDATAKSHERYHTNISSLGDDVLILAKPKSRHSVSSTGVWWYFWYDCDGSDSCIGRFQTDDSDAMVRQSFAQFADSVTNDAPIVLDPSSFSGWVSW